MLQQLNYIKQVNIIRDILRLTKTEGKQSIANKPALFRS